jgi:hypothetical protein
VCKHDLDAGADDLRHMATEQLLDFLANHDNDPAKAGARRVVDAVVEQSLTVRTDRSELLQPAVARAEAGR